MKTHIAILAGVMLSATVFAAGDIGNPKRTTKMACEGRACCRPPQSKAPSTADAGAEDRFRMKYGRNTPGEEARQKAAREMYAKNMLNCAKHGCGGGSQEKPTATAPGAVNADPGVETRFRMKFGRNSPVEELRFARNREKEKPLVTASADRTICESGCCDHTR